MLSLFDPFVSLKFLISFHGIFQLVDRNLFMGRTFTQFVVLGGRAKRGVALSEESALIEVVWYLFQVCL